MIIPHLGPWVGAVAALRLCVAFLTVFAAWRFRVNLFRVIRFRFDARPGDALCAFVCVASAGLCILSVYGLTFVVRAGFAPTDLALWSRAFAAAGYSVLAFAYAMLIAGVTTRASGRAEGVRAFRRVAAIIVTMIGIGAFL